MNLIVLRRWRVWILAAALLVGAAGGLDAATLRGRLFAIGPAGAFPVGGIAVTVSRPNMGRSFPSYSGMDGMFYLNISPGPYVLEVWYSRDPRVPPMVFQILVTEPLTDIPPIRLG